MQTVMARTRLPGRTSLLAFDDTDSRDGGCTTQLAFQVLLALPELALTGMPRLVRLNPNVPWKTRGNAAVVLPLGMPRGAATRVGELRGHEIRAFPDAAPAAPDEAMLERAWKVIQAQAQPEAEPGMAWFEEPPPALSYWQAVRTRVDAEAARNAMQAMGVAHRAKTGRALVGCLAAAAWPGPASSCEFIAYRHPSRWGTPRNVDARPLAALDATGATFHTHDDSEGRLVCVPHGPDPVLLGLRGRDPEALRAAALGKVGLAAGEDVDAWLLWATNQASGDHVARVDSVAEAPEWGTVEVAATVRGMAETRHGGHVHVALEDAAGLAFEAIAFEPTKGLRDVVRQLRPSDLVTAVGAFESGVVRLEKLRVDALASYPVKLANPVCPTCGRSMKSAGVGQGYRCRDCGTKAPPASAGWAPELRSIALGWYEVPVMARRHLHRPVAWTRRP